MKQKNNSVLIISRGRVRKVNGQLFIQDREGEYLDDIAPLFDEVIIFTQILETNPGNINYKLNSNNVKVFTYKKTSTKVIFELFRTISGVDLVYGFIPSKLSVISGVITRIMGKKYISYCGNPWDELYKNRLLKFIYHYIEVINCLMANKIIVNNNKLKSSVSPHKIIKTKPFISKKIVESFREKRTETKYFSKYDIKFLTIANLQKKKNLKENIKLIDYLNKKDRSYEYSLTIVGDDSDKIYLKELNNLISRLDIKENINIKGYVKSEDLLIEYYETHDFFLLMSQSEGFPRVIWEALMCNLPVVIPNLYNIEEELKELKDDSHIFIYSKNNDKKYNCIKKYVEKTVEKEGFKKSDRLINYLNGILQKGHKEVLLDAIR